ncbi:MAG: hypothetical protein IKS79_03985 [Bacteroidales bacterium]|nr:hypothetical protein [Bacteroidales bacterium]
MGRKKQHIEKGFLWNVEVLKHGKGLIKIHSIIDRTASDYPKLIQIAKHFASEGAVVELTPKFSRPNGIIYNSVYGDLKETKYYGKCPDLKINGLWYEHEGLKTGRGKRAFGNMMKRGLKQANRLILEECGLTDRWMKKSINKRIMDGREINEVWLWGVSEIKLLYKKQEE